MKENAKKRISILDCIIITIELVLILFLTFGKIFDKTPSIFGYNIYTIATESMTPTLKVKDVIICKEYNDDMELKVGDIITYNGKVGSYLGKKITHRITKIEEDELTGITYITTKGDNNDAIDPIITTDDVVAKMVYKTVVITFILKITSNFFGFFIIVICPILYLLISSIVDYVKSSKLETSGETDSENIIDERKENQ